MVNVVYVFVVKHARQIDDHVPFQTAQTKARKLCTPTVHG